jgi:hypothetical protein
MVAPALIPLLKIVGLGGRAGRVGGRGGRRRRGGGGGGGPAPSRRAAKGLLMFGAFLLLLLLPSILCVWVWVRAVAHRMDAPGAWWYTEEKKKKAREGRWSWET